MHPEIVAKFILSNTVVVGQLNNKVVIFGTKSNHCFAPSSVVRAALMQNVTKHMLYKMLQGFSAVMDDAHTHCMTLCSLPQILHGVKPSD